MPGIEFGLELPPFAPDFVESLSVLNELVFGQSDINHIQWRLSHMPDVSTFQATLDRALIAFKVGFARSETHYYSWLGGVHPDFRRRGIATELMKRQHAWLIERDYSFVETEANRENRAMAEANLRNGFAICGVRVDPHRTQVLYSKALR